jgi:predicted ferric reductase
MDYAEQTGQIGVVRPTAPIPSGRPRQQRSTVVGRDGQVTSPRARGRTSQQYIVALYWIGMVVSVYLWWHDTPAGSVSTMAGALIEAGRITGMIGGYILLIQILLMSRVGWLDRRVGAGELVAWHRELGGLLVVMILAHMVLLLLGYGANDQKSILAEALSMMTTFQDMISAFVATGILVGIGLLAIRGIRAIMNYELWYYLHLTSYVVLLLSYGHQFADGEQLIEGAFGHIAWLCFYVFVLANLVWGRVIGPVRLNLRHRLEVAEVVPEGPDTFSVYVRGHRLDKLQARAGQFFRWRFLAGGHWWQAHPFSLSAAPNGTWLRLTIKVAGDHTEQLRWLDPGTRVFAEGPSGTFTADRRARHRALLIAGGSGIAPIRALLEDLPRGTIVLYRASSPDDILFREELDWLADARDAEVFYIIGGREDPGPRRAMTPKGFRQLVPDIGRRDVYLCGPSGLVNASVAVLKKLHIPKRQIHLDPFEF